MADVPTTSAAQSPPAGHRRRPLLLPVSAFAAGIFLDALRQPSLSLLGELCSTTILFAVFLFLFGRRAASASPVGGGGFLSGPARRAALRLLFGMWVGLLAGAVVHALQVRLPGPADVSRRLPETPVLCRVRGTVIEARRRKDRDAAWTVDVSALSDATEKMRSATGRAAVSVPGGAAGFSVGDRVEFLARLEAPRPGTLPGGYDRAPALARRGVRRVGVVEAGSIRARPGGPSWRPDLRLRRWSEVLAAEVEKRLPPRQAGLLNAILLGRREGLNPEDREAFSRSGTAHLLAVSGLHLYCTAFLLFGLLSLLGFSRRRAAWWTAAAAVAFCFLTGARESVVRATVMVTIYAGGLILRRPPDVLNSLAAAAFVILAVRPGALFEAGVQLSFAAVAAISLLVPLLEAAWCASYAPSSSLEERFEARRFPVKGAAVFRLAFFTVFAAWVGTVPLVAWHMGRFVPFGWAVNLAAVPLAAPLLLGGVLLLVSSFVCGATPAALIAAVLLQLLLFMEGLAHFAAALPGAAWDVPPPGALLGAAYAATIIAVWHFHGPLLVGAERRDRHAFLRVAGFLAAAVALVPAAALFRDAPKETTVTFLDLRRGRAALVETPAGETALVDCGGRGEGRRLAESLRRRGVRRVGLLIVTEDDVDAWGGAAAVVSRLRVERVVLPPGAAPSGGMRELEHLLTARGVPYERPADRSGAPRLLRGPGGLSWKLLDDGPVSAAGRVPDAAALCVLLDTGTTRVLFVRARSTTALRRLAVRAGELRAAVVRLLPARSGGFPSETARFLSRTACRLLVVGDGFSRPEEAEGYNLSALARQRGFRLVGPRRFGSLRVGDLAGPAPLAAFRGGRWTKLEF